MALTRADFAIQRTKAIVEVFNNSAKDFLAEVMSQQIFNFKTTSEVEETFTSTEGLKGFKEGGPLETPPVLTLEDGYKVTFSEKRYMGALVIPSTIYKREAQDTTWKVKEFLVEESKAVMVEARTNIVQNAYVMLNDAHDAGSDFLAPDAVEIFGAHVWKTGTTFNNKVTKKFDEDAMDAARKYAGKFKMSDGKESPLKWGTIVVKEGSDASKEAIKQFASEITPTALGDVNIYKGAVTILETPHISDANENHWSLWDFRVKPSPLYVGIGEMPTMENPIVLENQAIRSNVEIFYKRGVINMPFNGYGSDGTI